MGELLTLIFIFIAIALAPFTAAFICKVIFWFAVNIPRYEPCKNPLVDDCNEDRYNEFLCGINGCITTSSYYVGMPQATCKRCGHKNRCAQPQVKEWSLPDRYDI